MSDEVLLTIMGLIVTWLGFLSVGFLKMHGTMIGMRQNCSNHKEASGLRHDRLEDLCATVKRMDRNIVRLGVAAEVQLEGH